MLYTIPESCFDNEVLNASGLVLVNFWAPWCGVCRLIDPLLHKFQADWRNKVKLVSINADRSLKLATTYRLQSLPTLIFFSNGELLYRLDSLHFENKAEVTAMLNALMHQAQALQTAKKMNHKQILSRVLPSGDRLC